MAAMATKALTPQCKDRLVLIVLYGVAQLETAVKVVLVAMVVTAVTVEMLWSEP